MVTIRKRLSTVLSLDDFENKARGHLPRPVFAYISGGAENNKSFNINKKCFDDLWFVPNVMRDVSHRHLSIKLFGKHYAMPFGISPLGLSALSAYRGDIVLTQAALASNIPMIMSGSSLIPLEEVAKINPDTWFQAYLPGSANAITALLDRIKEAGFSTLVITVDTPVAANRENNIRAGFSTPIKPTIRLGWDGITHPRWLFGTFFKTIIKHGLPHFENNYAHRGAPILSRNVVRDISDRSHLDWNILEEIRKRWPGTLVIKGILAPQDARRATQAGVDGIIVSNHGGRQLDGAIPPLWILPEIVTTCPEIPIMYDSGIRRGGDVLKALSLGASFVFAGRPFGFAAAYAGQAGVSHAIQLLSQEISRNMAMLGITTLDDAKHIQLKTSRQGILAIEDHANSMHNK